jgi:hypothetical protein
MEETACFPWSFGHSDLALDSDFEFRASGFAVAMPSEAVVHVLIEN